MAADSRCWGFPAGIAPSHSAESQQGAGGVATTSDITLVFPIRLEGVAQPRLTASFRAFFVRHQRAAAWWKLEESRVPS